MKTSQKEIVVDEIKIYSVRGHNVKLDSDLAQLYEVTTFNLNKAVKRNIERFPADFLLCLTKQEVRNLIFQIGISSSGKHGGRRKAPYAFTQEGVAMLSSILRSERAVQVNIAIMRAFVQMREVLISNKDLEIKLSELEAKYERHDGELAIVFDAIRKLMSFRARPRKRIAALGKETS